MSSNTVLDNLSESALGTAEPVAAPHQRVEAHSGAGHRTNLRLAWLTTEYPKASHTFVRREIEAVESLGYDIERFSVRPAGPMADPVDLREAERTTCLLRLPILRHLWSLILLAFLHPARFVHASKTAFSMWRTSNRGVVRHFAYLVEACTLTRMLGQRGISHVHVHFGKNAADVARLVRCLGGPTYSMQIHGPGEFDDPVGHSLGPKVAESLFTTAITSYAGAQLRRWTPTQHWDRIHTIRCGVNEVFLNHFQPFEGDSQQVVCVGRLTAQKGQLLLLDSVAAAVRNGHSGLRLVFAGDGEMRSQIEDRIRELAIQNHVEISGWIGEEDVRRLILKSRAMILPSFAEGLPVAIMEAFALGRPVISSCITGVPELVEAGRNGWLVVAGDSNGTAKALGECLDASPETIRRMGEYGRERVLEQHDIRTEASRLASLLDQYVSE